MPFELRVEYDHDFFPVALKLFGYLRKSFRIQQAAFGVAYVHHLEVSRLIGGCLKQGIHVSKLFGYQVSSVCRRFSTAFDLS